MVLQFLDKLTEAGYRIFDFSEALGLAESMGLKRSSMTYILRSLIENKMIRPLYRGTYAIEDNILSGSPLHKFEIGIHLSKGGAICCWSSFSFHELTDQVLTKVFAFTPSLSKYRKKDYRRTIEGYEFQLIQVKPEDIWGVERYFIGEVKLSITNLERTLLDGLSYPQYCGGFREVLNGFSMARNKINIERILSYSKKCPIAVKKRLGWIFTMLEIGDMSSLLSEVTTSRYDKLDPSGPRRGKYNKTWMIMENF